MAPAYQAGSFGFLAGRASDPPIILPDEKREMPLFRSPKGRCIIKGVESGGDPGRRPGPANARRRNKRSSQSGH